MKPTLVHLPPEMIEDLDRRRAGTGVSRSQIIRDAIAGYVRDEESSRLAERYRVAYEDQPVTDPDEWGNLGAWIAGVRRMRST